MDIHCPGSFFMHLYVVRSSLELELHLQKCKNSHIRNADKLFVLVIKDVVDSCRYRGSRTWQAVASVHIDNVHGLKDVPVYT